MTPEKVPSFLQSLRNHGRILRINPDKNEFFARKHFLLDSPISRSEIFNKKSALFSSLATKETTFQGVKFKAGTAKIRSLKFNRIFRDKIPGIDLHFALTSCREFCYQCLNGDSFCRDVVSYKTHISLQNFQASITTEDRRIEANRNN